MVDHELVPVYSPWIQKGVVLLKVTFYEYKAVLSSSWGLCWNIHHDFTQCEHLTIHFFFPSSTHDPNTVGYICGWSMVQNTLFGHTPFSFIEFSLRVAYCLQPIITPGRLHMLWISFYYLWNSCIDLSSHIDFPYFFLRSLKIEPFEEGKKNSLRVDNGLCEILDSGSCLHSLSASERHFTFCGVSSYIMSFL